MRVKWLLSKLSVMIWYWGVSIKLAFIGEMF